MYKGYDNNSGCETAWNIRKINLDNYDAGKLFQIEKEKKKVFFKKRLYPISTGYVLEVKPS